MQSLGGAAAITSTRAREAMLKEEGSEVGGELQAGPLPRRQRGLARELGVPCKARAIWGRVFWNIQLKGDQG